MALRGEVAYKVKRAILILRQFTIGQLADITHLDYPSVETVVHRLVQDGLLIRAEEATGVPSKRGRPRQHYTLADGPSQIRKLRASVDAFEFEESSLVSARNKPESAYFLQAISRLDEMEQGIVEPAPEICDEIEKQLKLARRYEAMLEEGNEVSTAYLDFAQARLEFLRQNTAEGTRFLAQARSVFQGLNLGDQVRLLDEYAVAISLQKRLAPKVPATLIASEDSPEQLKKILEPLSHLSMSPALASVIRQVAEIAVGATRAKARSIEENKRLQLRNDMLVKQNAQFELEYQTSVLLNKMLQPPLSGSPPSYPGRGFPVPLLKEKQDDLVLRDVMGEAIAQQFWSEGDAERESRQHLRKFKFRLH